MGDMESEWALFRAAIVEAAVMSYGHARQPGLEVAVVEVRGAVRLKKESYRAWMACETPKAADGYQRAK
ncbi:hypothetical protein L3Q82_000026 [Scortum barcoo]|uniref:Uncharacterized protein n=1 Tax=Scortum barcoo TaxID=214431 RepID=A0ACB8XA31_9TELE|nr:hypothetical protein L3Q82_000026 [Scortum barcoo]